MTTAELIAANIPTNNTFEATAAKVREVLLQMNNEIIAAATIGMTQEFTETFLNAPGYSVDLAHTLDSQFICVDIWLTTGEKIAYESYSVLCESTSNIVITKPNAGYWADAKIILTKKG